MGYVGYVDIQTDKIKTSVWTLIELETICSVRNQRLPH